MCGGCRGAGCGGGGWGEGVWRCGGCGEEGVEVGGVGSVDGVESVVLCICISITDQYLLPIHK